MAATNWDTGYSVTGICNALVADKPVTTAVVANGTVAVNNPGRKSITIQNLANAPLYVYLGTGASNVLYSAILVPDATGNGYGGSEKWSRDDYTGPVSVWASGTPNCLVVETTGGSYQ